MSSILGNPRKHNYLRGINLEEQVKDKKSILVMPEIKAFPRCDSKEEEGGILGSQQLEKISEYGLFPPLQGKRAAGSPSLSFLVTALLRICMKSAGGLPRAAEQQLD